MSEVKKNKLVKSWVNNHIKDSYVHMAKKDGYRSRAAYKLIEIDTQFGIFHKGAVVVDLGCAPGSWSQVVLRKLDHQVKLIGVDLLEIDPISGLDFIHGDFTNDEVLHKLEEKLNTQKVDVVLSDMSPNLSGIRGVDQARSAYLIELAFDFIVNYLKQDGAAVIKLFHGGEFDSLVAQARGLFTKVAIHKPKASREKSSETYLVCQTLRTCRL